jgi:hypothetical protein
MPAWRSGCRRWRTALALAWVRDRPGGPIRVLAAGAGLAGAQDRGQVLLTLPAGARGIQLDAGAAVRMLAAVPCWTRIAGVADALLGDPGDGGAGPGQVRVPPSLEDGLLSVWLDGFAWLLLAEPASPATAGELAAEAARAQLAAQQFSSPGHKLTARRAAALHDELRRCACRKLIHAR